MVKEDDVASLRGQPELLKPWAQDAYREGKTFHDVIVAIYGVDLPLEAYVFHRSRPRELEFPVDRFFHPWELIEMAGPRYKGDSIGERYAEQETKELERNPDFLPLMLLVAGETELDGYVIGYSLEQLAQGKTTILGHSDGIAEADKRSVVLGDSLLSVLQQWMTRFHEMELADYQHPANRRRGSDNHVENATQWLKDLEQLRRKVAEQQLAADRSTS